MCSSNTDPIISLYTVMYSSNTDSIVSLYTVMCSNNTDSIISLYTVMYSGSIGCTVPHNCFRPPSWLVDGLSSTGPARLVFASLSTGFVKQKVKV